MDPIRQCRTKLLVVLLALAGAALCTCARGAAADLNGDGRDECVFTIGATVYAVGTDKAGKGSVPWTLDLPGRAGPVTIADVNGDGTARIVVSCEDGKVYGLGPAQP